MIRDQEPRLLMAVLQLMRLPTVFTALSNILCGYFVTHRLAVTDVWSQWQLWLLLASSSGLYLGGMVLNDVCDVRLDAIERPERPIPSGRISRRAAAWLGALLTLAGVGVAFGAGVVSGVVALLIVPCVLLYNVWLKCTIAAPIGMGACRFLNLMLGASAVPWESVWSFPVVSIAAGLAIYVVGVTCFARNEAANSGRAWLLAGAVFIVAALGLDAWTVTASGAAKSVITGGRMVLLLLGLNLLMRMAAAVSNPTPGRVQKTVGLMLLSLIVRDASIVFGLTGDARLAVLVVALIPPAVLLRRFIPMS